MKHIKAFDEVNESSRLGPTLAPAEMKKLASSLKFPSGSGRREYSTTIYWAKRGGHGGAKTVSAVVDNAIKSGWTKPESKHTSNATGDIVTNQDSLIDPSGKYMLKSYKRYGNTASENWFELTIELIKGN